MRISLTSNKINKQRSRLAGPIGFRLFGCSAACWKQLMYPGFRKKVDHPGMLDRLGPVSQGFVSLAGDVLWEMLGM